ncbi:MAG: Stk1 family PASTA domain-containing Ser/Thr kinase [Eggerthellaceae bacterium]|nr:Stk1 family PASTA domain-containing Ser/Thr kinase [Eggerthellaceae bacterium]
MNDSMIGKLIASRYQITERLGIGGMAEVFKAQDIVLGRTVALKIMLPQYAADPEFTQRFRQEAASAANLQNPYIVNIYDWGQDDGTYFIVMEYVRGSDLKECIKQRGAINQRKVAEIGMQVCQALTAAHHLDIVHRDIKPQNIMIQPDGNVKVMDFGIARAKNSVKTQTSSVLGTAHYISPEQAQGKELTFTSDIYSLGIVMYEAATGTLPFDGPDAVSVALKQVNEQPQPLRQRKADIDPAFEAIVLKAISKDPRNRFETASDMRTALNDYLMGRQVRGLGSFSTAATSVISTVGPDGGAVSTLDKTAVMTNGFINGNGTVRQTTGSQERIFKGTQQTEEPKKNRKKVFAIAAIVIAAIAIAFALIFVIGNSREETFPVPNVTGKTYEEAVVVLQDAGFSVGKTTKDNSETIAEGYVISQDPSGNSNAPKSKKINLVVSMGPGKVEVPDLTNMTATEAQAALEKVGLKAKAGEAKYSSEVKVNHIISQSPEAKATVEKGSEVTYVLSLGEENIEIPYVVGMGEDAAWNSLQGAGFSVHSTTEYSSSVEKGVVISQYPTGSAVKGSSVSIVVSNGPEPSPEPEPTPTPEPEPGPDPTPGPTPQPENS